MDVSDGNDSPTRLQGKRSAVLVCWLLGLGSLLAWNSMLTIGDYSYKIFPNYHPSRVLTLVYQPFAIGRLTVYAYNESRIHTRWRIIAGYTLYFIGTLGCLLLDLGTSGKGGIGYYAGLCILVATFGVADAHVQGGMCGDLAIMLPDFMQLEHSAKVADRFTLKQLIHQNWDYLLDLYLIYALTLSIFPGFICENTGTHRLGNWYAIVLVAMFNVLDLIGRYTPLIKCLKMESRKGLMTTILARFLFIPVFYFTAKYADQGWMIFLSRCWGSPMDILPYV